MACALKACIEHLKCTKVQINVDQMRQLLKFTGIQLATFQHFTSTIGTGL